MEWAVLVLVLGAEVPGNDRDVAVVALSHSYQRWLEGIAFKSTYRLGMTTDESLDSAIAQGALSRAKSPSSGVFIKRGEVIRKSVGRSAPVSVRDPTGVQAVAVNDDVVGNGNILLRYYPRQGSLADEAHFAFAPEAKIGSGSTGCSFIEMSPLNPFGGCGEDPYGKKSFHKGREITFDVKKLDNTHVSVTAKSTFTQGTTHEDYTSTVIWWNKPELPVVESAVRSIADRSGKILCEVRARLEDFQECPGGFVARRVCLAIGPWKGKGSVVVKEWLSDDLGRDSPKDADFTITVPASTRIGGLKQPPPSGRERQLTLANIRPDMLLQDRGLLNPGPQGIGPTHVGQAGSMSAWFWLAAAILSVLVSVLVLRRLRRSRQHVARDS